MSAADVLQTTLTPDERAIAIDQLEAALDHRLSVLVAGYERRWEALPPSVRAWLSEMLAFIVVDLRRALRAVVHEVLPLPRVH